MLRTRLLPFVFLAASLEAQPISQLPYSPSLDTSSMDTTVSACQNFYQFSCGGWIRKNPIPADRSHWDVYTKLGYDNEQFLWGLLEEAAKEGAGRSAAQVRIGDFYHACMDTGAIEKAGVQPIQPQLDAIGKITSVQDLSRVLTSEKAAGIGEAALFGFSSNQDFANSQDVIAFAGRGQLGLPDRDYYTKTDPKSIEIRAKYVAHVARMFTLAGETPAAAQTHAKQVMAMETDLAQSELTRVELRDPHKLFHKLSRSELRALTPSYDWEGLYRELHVPDETRVINVTEPAYYKEVEHQLQSRSIEDWKAFLRWDLLGASAPHLSKAFEQADFDFYQKYLRGTPEMEPRWRKCVREVDQNLGEELGKVFVAKTFTPETKARTLAMTQNIEREMENDLKQIPWMGEETRKQALLKLHAIVNKIGYPDHWRDYSALEVKRNDYRGNVRRGSQFEMRRELAKIGKPLDRTEWGMTPPTINAYFNPQMNDINFPAGVLQPPLYDPKLDDAPNYGNTGSTIGHELTHGFDDEGRQFDAAGNLKDWWQPSDANEFQKRADCVSTQYSGYTAVDDIKINGKLTLGEDVADLGGTLLAYLAWKHATYGQNLKPIDGYTPDQRFFVGMAQWACGDVRPEQKRDLALTDPHSPLEYRVNGVVSNLPEFARAFGCKVGDAMVRPDPCRVW